MASMGLIEASITFLCFLLFCCFLIKKSFIFSSIKETLESSFWNWPVVGMLPGLLIRVHNINDALADLMEKHNMTFMFKGPWFIGMDLLVTVNPQNIHHVLTSNFSNYVKGPEFKEIFDVYGNPLFTVDSEIWKNMRMCTQSMANHQGFQKLSENTTKDKLKDVLLPLLTHFAEERTVVDLQDVFSRFAFDTTLVTITGCDPRSLSIDMPELDDFAEALDDAGETVLYRHVLPRFVWKLQSWMGLGHEKKTTEAAATFDCVCAKYIAAKREEIRSQGITHQGEDILTSSIKLDATKYEVLNTGNDKFLKDIILTFVVAERDTITSALTWFFWLLSENPKVVKKIREEINSQEMSSSTDIKEFLNKLVYLHGALCEALRLYPPVSFERKSSINPDVLPCGQHVKANANIIIPIYALGRMKAVWGEDAHEFKPERWVSETGGVRREPSFKFLTFNAGPRTCVGKNLAMTTMKTVAVEILQNFDVKVVEGQTIKPKPGFILVMKHGLKVTLSQRSST